MKLAEIKGKDSRELRLDLQALRNDVMRLSTVDVADEADPTGIVLEPGIVESLARGWVWIRHDTRFLCHLAGFRRRLRGAGDSSGWRSVSERSAQPAGRRRQRPA